MSKIEVDKIDPQSGTALEIGTSGDTVTVPSGVGLTLTDSTLLLPTTITSTTEVKTNKISPATGVAFALGDSGDTFTVPAGATIVNSGTATGFGGGKIGQVVSTTVTDTTTSTSTSLADVAGMTVAITPAATSSKVLVLVTTSMCNIAAGRHSQVCLLRDATEICIGDAAGSRSRESFSFYGEFARDIHQTGIIFLDSPSSTSELTYKLQWTTESGGTVYLNRTSTDTDSDIYNRTASTITVMEVLA
jgi:hypothetical protein